MGGSCSCARTNTKKNRIEILQDNLQKKDDVIKKKDDALKALALEKEKALKKKDDENEKALNEKDETIKKLKEEILRKNGIPIEEVEEKKIQEKGKYPSSMSEDRIFEYQNSIDSKGFLKPIYTKKKKKIGNTKNTINKKKILHEEENKISNQLEEREKKIKIKEMKKITIPVIKNKNTFLEEDDDEKNENLNFLGFSKDLLKPLNIKIKTEKEDIPKIEISGTGSKNELKKMFGIK